MGACECFFLFLFVLADMLLPPCQFSATKQSIRASPEGSYVDTNAFANVTVMGLAKSPVRIWLNERLLGLENWEYDGEKAVLSLHGLGPLFPRGAWAESWEVTWE